MADDQNTETTDEGTAEGQQDPTAGLKSALDKERAEKRDLAKKAKAADALQAELDKLRADQMGEAEKAIAQARKEAADEASKTTAERYRARIVASEIKAAAGGKLANPALAVRLIDHSEFELDDNDEVDPKAIASAIDKLLADEPYLAAQSGPRPGGADHGVRDNPAPADKLAAGLAQHMK